MNECGGMKAKRLVWTTIDVHLEVLIRILLHLSLVMLGISYTHDQISLIITENITMPATHPKTAAAYPQ